MSVRGPGRRVGAPPRDCGRVRERRLGRNRKNHPPSNDPSTICTGASVVLGPCHRGRCRSSVLTRTPGGVVVARCPHRGRNTQDSPNRHLRVWGRRARGSERKGLGLAERGHRARGRDGDVALPRTFERCHTRCVGRSDRCGVDGIPETRGSFASTSAWRRGRVPCRRGRRASPRPFAIGAYRRLVRGRFTTAATGFVASPDVAPQTPGQGRSGLQVRAGTTWGPAPSSTALAASTWSKEGTPQSGL